MLKANVGLSRKLSENYNPPGSPEPGGRDQRHPGRSRGRHREDQGTLRPRRGGPEPEVRSRPTSPTRPSPPGTPTPSPANNGHSNARPAPEANGHPPATAIGTRSPRTGEPATNKQVPVPPDPGQAAEAVRAQAGRLHRGGHRPTLHPLRPDQEGGRGRHRRPQPRRRRGQPVPALKPRNDIDFEAPGTGDRPRPRFLSGGPMRAAVTRPHWSYSSVSQYLKCPFSIYFERVLRLPRKDRLRRPGARLVRPLRPGRLPPQAPGPTSPSQPHQVREAFLAAWEDQADDGSRSSTEQANPSDDSLALGIALIEIYLKEPPPTNIVAVESPMLAPITNSRGEYWRSRSWSSPT